MMTARPGHLTTFDYLGLHRYFLTYCTHERQRTFVAADRVALVRTQIERAACEHDFSITAYCFMPDHVHLLIEGQSDDSDGRRFIARAKQYSGFHYQAAFGARLWQRYGFEHVLHDDEATISVTRYIVENPVRARLVTSAVDYPFSGSSVYTMEQLVDAVQLAPKWYSGSG